MASSVQPCVCLFKLLSDWVDNLWLHAGVHVCSFPAVSTIAICRDNSSPGLTAPLCSPYAQTRQCDTSDVCVCETVYPLALRVSRKEVWVCLCAGCEEGDHICDSARRFIAHSNARPPKPLPSSLSGDGAWRHVANPPLLCLLFARQLIIESALPCTAQQSIINPFSQWFPAARSKQGFNLWCLVRMLGWWGGGVLSQIIQRMRLIPPLCLIMSFTAEVKRWGNPGFFWSHERTGSPERIKVWFDSSEIMILVSADLWHLWENQRLMWRVKANGNDTLYTWKSRCD